MPYTPNLLKALSVFLFVSLLGCIPHYRSAHPLNAGEIQVAYNAPFSGNARIGITDRLQYRISVLPFVQETDLCYSFGKNIYCSVAFGAANYDKGPITIGSSLTASKSYGERIIPYIGLGYNFAIINEHQDSLWHFGQVSIGSELFLFKRNEKRYNLIFTPEINLWIDKQGVPYSMDSRGPKLMPWGSLGVGFGYHF